MNALLANYRRLIRNLDRIGAAVRKRYASSMACSKGCAECCILTSVFPVEAYAIHRYLTDHPGIIKGLARKGKAGQCHFLNAQGACRIYPARPVICRTHGYPLLVEGKADFCPQNFKTLSAISSDCFTDLSRLNFALAAVDLEFRRAWKGGALPVRIRLAALLRTFSHHSPKGNA